MRKMITLRAIAKRLNTDIQTARVLLYEKYPVFVGTTEKKDVFYKDDVDTFLEKNKSSVEVIIRGAKLRAMDRLHIKPNNGVEESLLDYYALEDTANVFNVTLEFMKRVRKEHIEQKFPPPALCYEGIEFWSLDALRYWATEIKQWEFDPTLRVQNQLPV